jgi:ketosteroid isomerase-like protein
MQPPYISHPPSASLIEQLEQRLRQAMLASDVHALDALVDDRLLFVGPDGALYSKAQDLELHRSGVQRIHRLDFAELAVETHGSFAVATVLADLEGSFDGQRFEGRFRYLRTWAGRGADWKVVAGSVQRLAG